MSQRRAWLTPEPPAAADYVCRRLIIPKDYVQHVNGALLTITEAGNWEQFGAVTPEEAAAVMLDMFIEFLSSEACMLGVVSPFLGSTPPPGAVLCNGAVLQRSDWPALYDLFDAELPFQIIDADTFYAPLLDNRSVIASGDMFPHMTWGGSWSREITVDNLPAHAHTIPAHQHTTHGHVTGLAVAPGEVPFNIPSLAPDVTSAVPLTTDEFGGNLALSIVPYYLALNYICWGR